MESKIQQTQQPNSMQMLPVVQQVGKQVKELSPDYQTYITETDSLMQYMLFCFCGHRYVEARRKVPNKFSTGTKYESFKKLVIDRKARIMDEYLAGELFSGIAPLISKVVQSSHMSKEQIYKLWNAKIDTQVFSLCDSYYREGNPHHLRINRIADIITTLCSFSAITSKAELGFFMREISDTIQSSAQFNTMDTNQPKKKEGWLSNLLP